MAVLLERKQSSLCRLVCLKPIYHQRRGSCCWCLGELVWACGEQRCLAPGQACGVKHCLSVPFNHVDKLSMKTILFLNWRPNKVGVGNLKGVNRKHFLVKKAKERQTHWPPVQYLPSLQQRSSWQWRRNQLRWFLTAVCEHCRKDLALILLVLTGI